MSSMLMVPLLAKRATAVDLSEDLVAYYTMDNVVGSALIDDAGSYDGVINGTGNFTAGVDGNCADFTSSNWYVDTFGLAGVQLDGMSFWLYTPSEITSSSALESFGTIFGSHGAIAVGAVSGMFANETLTIFWFDGSASAYYIYITENIPAGWNNIIINNESGVYRIKLNATDVTTSTDAIGSPPGPPYNLDYLTIGKRSSYSIYATTLKIDHMRIYSNSGAGLSAAKIVALANEF